MIPNLRAEWFWTDRWNGSSAFLLPLEARGLYREMLTQAWRRGAKLPHSLDAVRRAVGVTDAEWERTWPAVAPYWHETPAGLLVNDTQVQVYGEAYARALTNHSRAEHAARTRWDKGDKRA